MLPYGIDIMFSFQKSKTIMKQHTFLFAISYLILARNFNFKQKNFAFSVLAQTQF